MKFKALPVTSLEDATVNFEQLQGAAWVTLAYLNSWTTTASGPSVAYFKDPLGFVHLRGRITGGATGTSPFALPAGARPYAGSDLYAAGAYNGTGTPGAAFLAVDQNGGTSLFYPAGYTDIGLGGITFLAEN